jgi:hypothetical protein
VDASAAPSAPSGARSVRTANSSVPEVERMPPPLAVGHSPLAEPPETNGTVGVWVRFSAGTAIVARTRQQKRAPRLVTSCLI